MVDASLSADEGFAGRDARPRRDFIAQVVRPKRSRGDFRIFGCGHRVDAFHGRRAAAANGGAATSLPGDGTALYDAVYLGSQALEQGSARRRRVLVLLTDAGETTSRADFETARRAAVRAEALLYTIVIRAG